MDSVTIIEKSPAGHSLQAPRARIGMIIPSVNSMSEPQFNHFAPPGLGVHVARARVAGEWKRPLAAMSEEIATSAKLLSDVEPDLIVFHCTDTSMTQGPQGEGRILDIVREATGIEALATSRLVLEALQALGLRKLVLLSPYKSNRNVIDYLHATGFAVVHDVALALDALEFANVTPREWTELARTHDRADARWDFPELHQHHSDGGDRRHRARARQAGGQQQSGRSIRLHQETEIEVGPGCALARSGPIDAAPERLSARPQAWVPEAQDDRIRERNGMTMQFARRACAAVVLALLSPAVLAQTYPSRQITLIVPFAPGGPADFLGRLIGQKMSEEFGQQIVVDNRPGANTIIGAQAVAKAAPDGYTLLMAIDGTLVMNPFLYSKLVYDPFKDFVPISLVALVPSAVVGNINIPVSSIKELVDQEKAKPGTFQIGISTPTSQVNVGLLNMMAGTNFTMVPYRGGTTQITGILAGDVPLGMESINVSLPLWREKKVKILGLVSAQRLSLAPEIPAIAETFPGYDLGTGRASSRRRALRAMS